MMTQKITFEFDVFDSVALLPDDQRDLMESAFAASRLAYAPYSKFNVGAAVLLENGAVITGSNKENASFPAGICAERNVIHRVSDQFPGAKIKSLAIATSAINSDIDGPLAPCGICRQVICESEKLQDSPIELLLMGTDGKVHRIYRSADLLPFHFYLPALKK